MIDRKQDPFVIKQNLQSYLQRGPILSAPLCRKNDDVSKQFEEADEACGHKKELFLEVNDQMPLSSEAYKYRGRAALPAEAAVIQSTQSKSKENSIPDYLTGPRRFGPETEHCTKMIEIRDKYRNTLSGFRHLYPNSKIVWKRPKVRQPRKSILIGGAVPREWTDATTTSFPFFYNGKGSQSETNSEKSKFSSGHDYG